MGLVALDETMSESGLESWVAKLEQISSLIQKTTLACSLSYPPPSFDQHLPTGVDPGLFDDLG